MFVLAVTILVRSRKALVACDHRVYRGSQLDTGSHRPRVADVAVSAGGNDDCSFNRPGLCRVPAAVRLTGAPCAVARDVRVWTSPRNGLRLGTARDRVAREARDAGIAVLQRRRGARSTGCHRSVHCRGLAVDAHAEGGRAWSTRVFVYAMGSTAAYWSLERGLAMFAGMTLLNRHFAGIQRDLVVAVIIPRNGFRPFA